MTKNRSSKASGFFQSKICSFIYRSAQASIPKVKASMPRNSTQWSLALTATGIVVTIGIYLHQTMSGPTEVVITSQPVVASTPISTQTPTPEPTPISTNLILDPSPESSFGCELQADRKHGGEVWTVTYRRGDDDMQPWLRMVREMGGDWNTERRCIEVADKMNVHKEAGLQDLAIRDDVNTPRQKVICAITELAPKACPLVLTLMPEDDPDEVLYDVLGALKLGRDAVLQCSSANACPIEAQYKVSVRHQLIWGE